MSLGHHIGPALNGQRVGDMGKVQMPQRHAEIIPVQHVRPGDGDVVAVNGRSAGQILHIRGEDYPEIDPGLAHRAAEIRGAVDRKRQPVTEAGVAVEVVVDGWGSLEGRELRHTVEIRGDA